MVRSNRYYIAPLLVWVFEFFRHEIQIIPAGVGEEPGVNRQGHITGLGIGAVHRMPEIFRVAHAEPPEASHHDDHQGEDLGGSEDVLYSGRPLDVVAINGS